MAASVSTARIQPATLIVIGSFVTQFVTIGGLFAYSVFFTELEREFGWSRTLLSSVSSTAVIVMGVLAIFAGQVSDRIGPRWVLTASGLSFGIGYMLMSQLQVPWQLIAAFGLMVGFGLSTHDVVTLSTIGRWFSDKRGQMTGIVKTGTACGQIVMPLVATALIVSMGWRIASLTIGIFGLTALVFAAQVMRSPDGPVASTNQASQPVNDQGLDFSQILRTRQFWTMCLLQFLFFPILTTIPLHIVAYGTDLGLTTATAAIVLSTIAAASIIGRLTIGPAVDRIGGRMGYTICFSLLLTGMLILRFTEQAWLLFPFALIYGIAHGGLFTLVAPTIAEVFGMKAHGSAFGIIIFFGTIGGALGPLLAGWSFDTTGNYQTAFITLAAIALSGLLIAQTLSARKHSA